MSGRPFFWWLRPKAYRAFLKREGQYVLERKVEDDKRRKQIEEGEIIPLVIGGHLLAHIYELGGTILLGMRMFSPSPVNDRAGKISKEIIRPLIEPHSWNSWAAEGLFNVETDFSTTEELYGYLDQELANRVSVKRLSFEEEKRVLPRLESFVN